MKILILFLSAFLVGILGRPWSPNSQKCIEELDIDKATIDIIYSPWDKRSENNETLNKFLECSWKKQGTINDNGEINWEKIYEILTVRTSQHASDSETVISERGNMYEYLIGKYLKKAYESCREWDNPDDKPGQRIVKLQNCVTEYLRLFVYEKPV